jgi:hypothetical protein
VEAGGDAATFSLQLPEGEASVDRVQEDAIAPKRRTAADYRGRGPLLVRNALQE